MWHPVMVFGWAIEEDDMDEWLLGIGAFTCWRSQKALSIFSAREGRWPTVDESAHFEAENYCKCGPKCWMRYMDNKYPAVIVVHPHDDANPLYFINLLDLTKFGNYGYGELDPDVIMGLMADTTRVKYWRAIAAKMTGEDQPPKLYCTNRADEDVKKTFL
jgi:hypothetical protein